MSIIQKPRKVGNLKVNLTSDLQVMTRVLACLSLVYTHQYLIVFMFITGVHLNIVLDSGLC